MNRGAAPNTTFLLNSNGYTLKVIPFFGIIVLKYLFCSLLADIIWPYQNNFIFLYRS